MTVRSTWTEPSPRRRSLTALLGAALAATLLALGAATPASAASTVLTVSGPSSINVGASATLSLTFSKGGKKATGKVTLEARESGGSWTPVQKVSVTKGKAKVKVAPKRSTSYRITRGSKVSKAFKVKVAQSWLGFTVSPSQVDAGSTVQGKIVLTRKGKRSSGFVYLEEKVGKTWRAVPDGKVKVPSSGVLYVDLSPSSPTTTYRAVRGKLVSKTRSVKVADWLGLELDAKRVATSKDSVKGTVTWFSKARPAKGTVKLQEKVGDAKWRTVQKVEVKDGKGSFSVVPETTRSYRVFVGDLRSPKRKVTVDVVIPASFTIHGSGWGHGLGMSQYGAYAMALAGRSVSEILTHYYTDTAVEQMSFPTGTASADQLSVQLIGPSPDAKTSVDVTVKDGGWRLQNADNKTVAVETKGSKITFKVESGKVAAYVNSASKPSETDSKLRLHWEGTRYYKSGSSAKTYVKVAGAHGSYRHGRLEITVKNGKLNIVNNLLLNTEYLYGIAEMPSSWGEKGPASLQAQAIAARNYAASKFFDSTGKPRTIDPDCRCHLVDDTRDQNFTGWDKENEGTNAKFGKLWKKAVDATNSDGGATGKVLRYVGSNTSFKGKLVTAYYSSSSGGGTLNSEDAWASVVPYIRSVEDPWSLEKASGNPNIAWTATFTQSQARSFFNLPDVVSITVSRYYAGGGVAELSATSSQGVTKKVSGKADSMRTGLNAAASGYVKSAFIKSFEPVGVY